MFANSTMSFPRFTMSPSMIVPGRWSFCPVFGRFARIAISVGAARLFAGTFMTWRILACVTASAPFVRSTNTPTRRTACCSAAIASVASAIQIMSAITPTAGHAPPCMSITDTPTTIIATVTTIPALAMARSVMDIGTGAMSAMAARTGITAIGTTDTMAIAIVATATKDRPCAATMARAMALPPFMLTVIAVARRLESTAPFQTCRAGASTTTLRPSPFVKGAGRSANMPTSVAVAR